MDRRDFLKKGTVAAGLAASQKVLQPLAKAAGRTAPSGSIPKRRLGKTGVELSIIGLGGMVVKDVEPRFASEIVAEAYDRGINYFDVAPTYGNAQERLGPALEPYRQKVFLACKTTKRDKSGAGQELEESLRLLRTDHLDLYQFHAVTTQEDVEKIFGPDGAMETFQAARQAGMIRFMGFSAHSVENALAMLDRYAFDTILFPTNFVLFSQANFGPQVLERARQKKMGILALKAMAKTVWPKGMKESDRPNPKCWYEPAALPEEATLALRWTLSQRITAAVPPGDEKYFRLAMDVAQKLQPLQPEEEKTLLARAAGVEPIFHLAKA
ncbi:MAG: aldo/keto reductase [Acidobacteriia bacterium]|nr:aldo/keto reductase [Terriglobia bacterium]